MIAVLALLIAILAALFPGQSSPGAGPTSGAMEVVARACPAGVAAADVSAAACPIWADGAAVQATDANNNAWGMNASRDASLPGNPVIYSLSDLKLGVYTLGDPVLPPGYSGFVIDGAQTSAGGVHQVDLSAANPDAKLTVYFLKST